MENARMNSGPAAMLAETTSSASGVVVSFALEGMPITGRLRLDLEFRGAATSICCPAWEVV